MTRSERRERYESVVRTVDLNTSTDPTVQLPPAMARGPLLNNRTQAGYDWREVKKSIKRAVENGDLVKITVDGTERYAPADADHLRSLAVDLAERDDPPSDAISTINGAIG